MDVIRHELIHRVAMSLRDYPVTALLGPRQCGKTTIARDFARRHRAEYFDLEDPVSMRRLSDPMRALSHVRGLIVVDEIQRSPELFPILRVLSDRHPLPARFLVLGSASPELLRQSSESLAGRIAHIEMSGFDMIEAGDRNLNRLWWRGGFPRSYLARTEDVGRDWLNNFIATFLERDIREFGVQIAAPLLRRFWSMLAHYHGQTWNASEVGRSLGQSHTTVQRYLDLLTSALVVRQLQPWFENIGKRQVKSPKVYVRDPGLLHALLEIPSMRMLEGHPKIGASWEGFVIEELIRATDARHAYFWGTQSGAELDLLLQLGGKRYGVEVKLNDAPDLTKSMQIALKDLELDLLYVVYPGRKHYWLHDQVQVLSLADARAKLTKVKAVGAA
ncbi:MAG: ATP-binding protein [Bryobacteraceae bacterium]